MNGEILNKTASGDLLFVGALRFANVLVFIDNAYLIRLKNYWEVSKILDLRL